MPSDVVSSWPGITLRSETPSAEPPERIDDVVDRSGDRMPLDLGAVYGVLAQLDSDAMGQRGAAPVEELGGDRCELVG